VRTAWEPRQPPESHRLVIRSDELEITLLPAKGADIYSVADRVTGVDVLFKTPWGWRDPAGLPSFGSSQNDWLARYAGGWQLLLPHAGPERPYAGVARGFHGEAAVVPWQVLQATSSSASLAVGLFTAPLAITRDIRLSGPTCRISETVTNLADEPVQVAWVHHPAFGRPFAGPACRLESGALTLISDTDEPGTLLPRDAVMPVRSVAGLSGQPVDLGRLPGDDEPRELFGALTDFRDGWYGLTNTELGFGIGISWDTEVFPHAWIWQQCHATQGFPWYGRAYAVAIEPANVLPGHGHVAGRERGQPPVLGPRASLCAELTLTRFDAGAPLTAISRDGSITRMER
jgi:hypothetical protein